MIDDITNANDTEDEDNETNGTMLYCLASPRMVVRQGLLTVQLAEDVGRFQVDLKRVGAPGHWIQIAYAWDQGGMGSTLWLNGTSVALPVTTTRTITTTTSEMNMNDTSDGLAPLRMKQMRLTRA